MRTLSIRQPWAWLIIRPDIEDHAARLQAIVNHAIKPVENRTWHTHYRGPLQIHASQAMTRSDYQACWLFLAADPRTQHVELPSPGALERGGVVGRVDLVGCVANHPSPYFCGPFGLVLANPMVRPFRPLKGALGLFDAAIA